MLSAYTTTRNDCVDVVTVGCGIKKKQDILVSDSTDVCLTIWEEEVGTMVPTQVIKAHQCSRKGI